MENKLFSVIRVTFVTTLLVTKVARGGQSLVDPDKLLLPFQQDFEECGICNGARILASGLTRYINCDATPFGNPTGTITLPRSRMTSLRSAKALHPTLPSSKPPFRA